MSKLKRSDWELLRYKYNVAFTKMKKEHFELLLNRLFSNPGLDSGSGEEVDETDALMVYLARGEPPIQPSPPDQ